MDAEQLERLLPAAYTLRDAESAQGGYLRGLLTVLAEQGDLVEQDLARLYDGWFIETCEPWVVAYLGDLLGVRRLHPIGTVGSTPRAYVANTIAYRRRKGTPGALEQLARDVTGWPVSTAELFRHVGWTQHVNHVRPEAVRTPDLRRADLLEAVGGPFDALQRTPDVHDPGPGRPNLPDVALSVWRLEPFRVAGAVARPVAAPADGRYTVDPTGLAVPLANAPLPEESITTLATARHVPGPLGRRELHRDLSRAAAGGGTGPRPAVRVLADTGSGLREVPPAEMTAADLSDPPSDLSSAPPSHRGAPVTTGWRRPPAPLLVAVDPVLGRLAFRDGVVPRRVEVAYTYLAAGRVGAGPYDRTGPRTTELLRAATFVRAVGTRLPPNPDLTRTTLTEALGDWGTPPPGTVGVIAVLDDRTYDGPLDVTVPAGCTLLLTGGVWPEAEEPPVAGVAADVTGLRLDERRPVVLGGLTVTGGPAPGPAPLRGELVVDGLVLTGGVTVADGDLGDLVLAHATVPPTAAVTVAGGNRDLTVLVDRCLTGPLRLPDGGPRLAVATSVVDGSGEPALDAPDVDVTLDAVTALGAVRTRSLTASDCLLDGSVSVARTQEGCVRYSYVPAGSVTPRRYRCQPELAASAPGAPDAGSVRARLTPQLVSRRPGDPGYGVLADRSAPELREGSSTASDLGAFGHLLRPQRESNLRTALDEYLRASVSAGIHHVT